MDSKIFYIYHNHISLGKSTKKPMAFRTAATRPACPTAPARWSNAPRRPWCAWLRKAAPAEDLIWLNQWTLYEAYDFNWLYNYKNSGDFYYNQWYNYNYNYNCNYNYNSDYDYILIQNMSYNMP